MDNNISNKSSKPKQVITLTECKQLVMNNVIDIGAFDGSFIALNTVNGIICIEGADLKIESLEKDGGKIYITGDVSAVYRPKDKKTGKNGIRSVFK